MSPRPPFPTRPDRARTGPIAYFDSGIGGLTVLAEVMKRRPAESSLYVADQLHVPYGGRPLVEIREFAETLCRFAFAAGAKIVVMACNVSSATFAPEARRRYGSLRLTGVVEPGALAAVHSSPGGRIGVLATEGTVASGAYPDAIGRLTSAASVTQVACPAFVPLVESGRTETPEARAAVAEALEPLRAAAVDTVILGCTHYPFLLPTLMAAAPDLRFVDPAVATAARVEACLDAPDGPAAATEAEPTHHRWLTTGDPAGFAPAAERFMGPLLRAPAEIDHLPWPGGALPVPGPAAQGRLA